MANWVCFFISNVTGWLINHFSISHSLVANVFPASPGLLFVIGPNIIDIVFGF